MRKIGATHPLMLLQVFAYTSLAASLTTENLCRTAGNYNISFLEIDPSKTPPGPKYSQPLVQTGADNYTIVLQPDAVPARFPPDDYFRVQYNSSYTGYFITLIKGIDRDGPTPGVSDDINVLSYKISCTPRNSTSPGVNSVLKIQITDANDNSPVFTRPLYTANISELTDIGLVIYEVSATDRDEAQNAQIVYSLTKSPGAMFDGSMYFTFAPGGAGSITLTAYLDFESMYLNTTYQSSQVYFNVTVTATDAGNPSRSSSAILIINVEDADDNGPEFLYPTCITSSKSPKLPACVRPKYRSSISCNSDQVTPLQLTPVPPDANEPDVYVNMTMQDGDTLDSPVNCSITETIPAGYQRLFRVGSIRDGLTKQYTCSVTYVPDADTPIGSLGLLQMEIIIKAEENGFYRRSEYASVVLRILESGSGDCPAGYNDQTTDNGVVICAARSPETDTRLALGLGLALGFAILIIIILVVVGVVVWKRRKPPPSDKVAHHYSTVDRTQQDGHHYDTPKGIESRKSEYVHANPKQSDEQSASREPAYCNLHPSQSDDQSHSSYQPHIYDVFVGGSVIRRDIPDSDIYANDTGI
ncbi:hypothetical protein BsWGS_13250 [Bradybaena similaris]